MGNEAKLMISLGTGLFAGWLAKELTKNYGAKKSKKIGTIVGGLATAAMLKQSFSRQEERTVGGNDLWFHIGKNMEGMTSPRITEINVHDRISQAVDDNLKFTSVASMACDEFVTKVLSDAGVKPNDWPDPNWTSVKGYRAYMKNSLKSVASKGWNIVIMISDNPTIELNGQLYETDPTPHMGLMNRDNDGRLTLVHYTHGEVKRQKFKNENDFVERMPYEVYVYDSAEYKSLE